MRPTGIQKLLYGFVIKHNKGFKREKLKIYQDFSLTKFACYDSSDVQGHFSNS